MVRRYFHPVWSVDIDPSRASQPSQPEPRFLCGNLLSAVFRASLRKRKPHALWISLPCEFYSRANPNQKATQDDRELLRQTILLVKYFRRQIYPFTVILENPKNRLAHELEPGGLLEDFVAKPADHCAYETEFAYRKPIWLYVLKEHADYYTFRTCAGDACPHTFRDPVSGRLNHKQTAQTGNRTTASGIVIPGCRNYDDRISLPPALCATCCWQMRRTLHALS